MEYWKTSDLVLETEWSVAVRAGKAVAAVQEVHSLSGPGCTCLPTSLLPFPRRLQALGIQWWRGNRSHLTWSLNSNKADRQMWKHRWSKSWKDIISHCSWGQPRKEEWSARPQRSCLSCWARRSSLGPWRSRVRAFWSQRLACAEDFWQV